jgi:hypothetical protein
MRCKYNDEAGDMSPHNWEAMTYVKHERLPITVDDSGYPNGKMAKIVEKAGHPVRMQRTLIPEWVGVIKQRRLRNVL